MTNIFQENMGHTISPAFSYKKRINASNSVQLKKTDRERSSSMSMIHSSTGCEPEVNRRPGLAWSEMNSLVEGPRPAHWIPSCKRPWGCTKALSRPHASWLRQVKAYLEDVGMRRPTSAWAMAEGKPKEYRHRVDAATRRPFVCSHT